MHTQFLLSYSVAVANHVYDFTGMTGRTWEWSAPLPCPRRDTDTEYYKRPPLSPPPDFSGHCEKKKKKAGNMGALGFCLRVVGSWSSRQGCLNIHHYQYGLFVLRKIGVVCFNPYFSTIVLVLACVFSRSSSFAFLPSSTPNFNSQL